MVRREALARLMPRTRIADRVEVADRFLRVRGGRWQAPLDLDTQPERTDHRRAGRILGQSDFRVAFELFEEATDQARSLSDGRSWLANLIDYAEFSYRAWIDTGQDEYREQIARRAPEIEQVISEYPFKDLEGSWQLLQGHLAIWDALDSLDSGEESGLNAARGHYEVGFALIAQGYVGSHGAARIASEFDRFRELLAKLHPDTQAAWEHELRHAWSGSTSLLARLDELY